MTSICLTMIVKNEAHVIARCLRSVRPLLSSYCINDNGSTDDTKAVIQKELAGIPGVIFDSPWKDFSTNRNEVFERARGMADYNLVVDADDEIEGSVTRALTKDFYWLTVTDENGSGSWTFERIHLFRNARPFRYEYVLHEQVVLPEGTKAEDGALLPGLSYKRHYDGARTRGDLEAKWLKDAEVCREALGREPESQHYASYYAQSLQAAGPAHFPDAIAACREHLRLSEAQNGAVLPRWQSYFRIATMTAALRKQAGGASEAEILDAFLRAYECYPARLEPLYELAEHLEDWGRWRLSYTLLKPRAHQPAPPVEGIPIEMAVYEWALKDRLTTACLHVKDFHLARRLAEELLASSALPPSERGRITMHYDRAVLEIAKADAQAGAVVHADDVTRRDLVPLPGDRSERRHAATPFFGGLFGEMVAQLAPGTGELALGVTLFSLVLSIRARNVLELGRYKGFSTFAIASALSFLAEHAWEEPAWGKVQAKEKGGHVDYRKFEEVGVVRKVYSVDPRPMPEAVDVLSRHGLKKYVTMIDAPLVERERLLGLADVLVCNPGTSVAGLAEHAGLLRAGGFVVIANALGGGAELARELGKVAPHFERLGIDTGYRGIVIFKKVEA